MDTTDRKGDVIITQTVFQINWAQMEAGNTTERGEDIGRKERKRRTRRTVRENGGTRESDRARAEQCEDVMER